MSSRRSLMHVLTLGILALTLVASAAAQKGESELDSSPPTGITEEKIIQQFAAKEKEFKQAREQYAYRQSLTVQTGATLDVTLGASGSSGGALSYSVSVQPAHGTLSTLNGAAVTYTPASGFVGSDQFSFQVTEGTVSSEDAVVTINVQAATGNVSSNSSSSSGGGGLINGGSLAAMFVGVILSLAARQRQRARSAFRQRAAIRPR